MKQPHYLAHAYYAQHGDDKLAGTIRLYANAVHFSSENDKGSISLPLAKLTIKLGGASNRLVFIEHPDYAEWVIFTSDLALLSDPIIAQHTNLKTHANKAKRQRRTGWWITAVVTLLLVAAPFVAFSQLDRLTTWLVPSIPVTVEKKLGQAVFAQYKIQHTLIEDQDAKQALDQLTQELFNAAKTDRYQFALHIANDNDLNAFALPNGTMVVNSGLILAADHADEVLGVLSHELSHVRQQHSMRQIISSAGVYIIISAVIGDTTGLLALINDAAPLLLRQSYSRFFETEADTEGAKLMTTIHADVNGLIRFFEKVKAKEDKALAQIEDQKTREAITTGFSFLSTHPATNERIAHLRSLAVKQGQVNANAAREASFQLLKTRIAALVTKPNSSTSSTSTPQPTTP